MIDLQERIKAQIVNTLSAQAKVHRGILFGSRARGDADERSDIDLAVDAPGIEQREWLDLWFQLEELDTLLAVNVAWLQEASPEFRDRILSEGEILYERG
ncbi:MAG: nucleotidyltransferase domain-containing protein [bacterium]